MNHEGDDGCVSDALTPLHLICRPGSPQTLTPYPRHPETGLGEPSAPAPLGRHVDLGNLQ